MKLDERWYDWNEKVELFTYHGTHNRKCKLTRSEAHYVFGRLQHNNKLFVSSDNRPNIEWTCFFWWAKTLFSYIIIYMWTQVTPHTSGKSVFFSLTNSSFWYMKTWNCNNIISHCTQNNIISKVLTRLYCNIFFFILVSYLGKLFSNW